MNGYLIVSKLLHEARFNLSSAQKLRQKIIDLKQEYAQEEDFAIRKALLGKIKRAQSDLALKPNKEYDYHRTYSGY